MSLCEACSQMPWKLFSSKARNRDRVNQLNGFTHLSKAYKLATSSLTCQLYAIITSNSLVWDDEIWNEPPTEQALNGPRYRNKQVYMYSRESDPFPRQSIVEGLKWSHIVVEVFPDRIESPGLNCELSVFAQSNSAAFKSGNVVGRPPLSNLGSDEAHSLLRSWLQSCNSNHEECLETLSGVKLDEHDEQCLPTRVIDVGPSDGSQLPRLLITQGRRGQYVTLSHCWGLPYRNILRTTKDTIQAHLNVLQYENMSQTYRDAVAVTRAIDLQYLWIDSLCIIQDDNADWERESNVMGLIYERAYLTIAASAIEKSMDGLFLPRPARPQAVELPYINISGDKEGSVFIAARPQYPKPVRPDMAVSALSGRAWATQEWILSRRMVHYMETGLIWTCKRVIQDEMGSNSKADDTKSDWDIIIDKYSKRQLTYEKDRLVALQGLANEMKKRRPDKYIHGMWTGDFPSQLSWIREGTLLRNEHLPDVPSWSWASTIGSVKSFKRSVFVYWKNWQDACHFSSVDDDGIPTLKGRMRKENGFRLQSLENFYSGRSPGTRLDFEWKFGLDDEMLPTNLEKREMSLIVDDFHDYIGWVVLDGIYPLAGHTHYFLISEERKDIDETHYNFEYENRHRCCQVLVLQPCTRHMMTFVRIGVGVMGDNMCTWFHSVDEQHIRIA